MFGDQGFFDEFYTLIFSKFSAPFAKSSWYLELFRMPFSFVDNWLIRLFFLKMCFCPCEGQMLAFFWLLPLQVNRFDLIIEWNYQRFQISFFHCFDWMKQFLRVGIKKLAKRFSDFRISSCFLTHFHIEAGYFYTFLWVST